MAILGLALLLSACGSGDADSNATTQGSSTATTTAAEPPPPKVVLDEVVKVDGRRGLYIRCSGEGSPTVVMDGGDGDTADSYAYAEPEVARETRTCVYDRAGLGRSDEPKGPRQLDDLVRDLEHLLEAGKVPGPYLLVGTSGGGYITAGYAVANRHKVAGMVFVDTPPPYPNPPREVIEETDPNNPSNLERRDYLQVEKDAWKARRRVGDVPLKIISANYHGDPQDPGERRNVTGQRGWRVLSPQAEQIVAETGHAVEEEDPDLVIKTILAAVNESR